MEVPVENKEFFKTTMCEGTKIKWAVFSDASGNGVLVRS